jgi:phospholipase C
VQDVPADDQHPDHDVSQGDRLVKHVYDTLRNSPLWEKSMLVVTYDEHGGFFDHVSPPTDCPNPDGKNATDVVGGFDFGRLGIRVPFVVASPYVPKNTVVDLPAKNSYEHSSLPATVRQLLAPDQPFLTKRDMWAASFEDVLSLSQPRNDCPTSLPTSATHRGITPGLEAAATGSRPLQGLQLSLVAMAAGLNVNINEKMASKDTARRVAAVQAAVKSEREAFDYISKEVGSLTGANPIELARMMY